MWEAPEEDDFRMAMAARGDWGRGNGFAPKAVRTAGEDGLVSEAAKVADGESLVLRIFGAIEVEDEEGCA